MYPEHPRLFIPVHHPAPNTHRCSPGSGSGSQSVPPPSCNIQAGRQAGQSPRALPKPPTSWSVQPEPVHGPGRSQGGYEPKPALSTFTHWLPEAHLVLAWLPLSHILQGNLGTPTSSPCCPFGMETLRSSSSSCPPP